MVSSVLNNNRRRATNDPCRSSKTILHRTTRIVTIRNAAIVSLLLILALQSHSTLLTSVFDGSSIQRNVVLRTSSTSSVNITTWDADYHGLLLSHQNHQQHQAMNNRTVCGDCYKSGRPMWELDFFLDIFEATRCVRICEPNSVAFYAKAFDRSLQPEVMLQVREQAFLPPVLFVTSDEYCNQAPRKEWKNIYQKFALVFRQYGCWDQYKSLYKQYPHVMTAPLGYMTGFLEGEHNAFDQLNAVEQSVNKTRRFAWAFVGNSKKTNRPEMINTFSDVQPGINTTANVRKMRSIYTNSNFVLSGRGNVNLDCFRHYEALLCGAIPVIAGPAKEIKESFGAFGGGGEKITASSLPPWIFAESWSSAKQTVQDLLDDEQRLKQRRLECILWMKEQILRIRQAVLSVPQIASPNMQRFNDKKWT